MYIREALRIAAERLARAGVPSPEVDARLLAAYLLDVEPMAVMSYDMPEPFRRPFEQHFGKLVDMRVERIPLQRIVGSAPFGPLELTVGQGVFIPRPETEVLADWAVRQLRDANVSHPRVVDLCAGSGALALYIKHYLPEAEVHCVELSSDAAHYTSLNAEGTGVHVHLGDATDEEVLAELDGTVDLVVSNPPYVPETDDLEPEVYHDPHMAVFSGEDGMELIPRMLPTIHRLLKPGGITGVEHDDSTSEAVQEAFRGHGGFEQVNVLRDLTGTARFVCAVKAE